MHHILSIFFIKLVTALITINALGSDTTYKSGPHTLITFSRYKADIEAKYPFLKNTYDFSQRVKWRGQSYPALVLNSQGVEGEIKYLQTLTYIELHSGLWRMVYVDSKICDKGTVIKNGKWTETWGCKDVEAPIGGVFANIYFLSDNADTQQVSTLWGQEIEPVLSEGTTPNSPAHPTLADIKKRVLGIGSTWGITETSWSGLDGSIHPSQPGIIISVKGQIDKTYRIDQSFLYVYNSEKTELHMKTIDGVICFFANSLNKEICDPIYQPTPASPMPLVMLNSEAISKTLDAEPQAKVPQSSFQCGNLSTNIHTIFQFHFESSIFSANDITTLREAFAQIPQAVDPVGLFIDQQNKETYLSALSAPFPHDVLLTRLQHEIQDGTGGDCSTLTPFLKNLESMVFKKTSVLNKFLGYVRANNYEEDKIADQMQSLSEEYQTWWKQLQVKAQDLKEYRRPVALDIAAGELARYAKTTLDRFAEPEEIMTAAFAKRDAYSQTFEVNHVVQNALTGPSKNLFFGLSMVTGHSGRHYIHSVHPQVQLNYDLMVGDEVSLINGVDGQKISASTLDTILVDTDKPLTLGLRRDSQSLVTTLQAQDLDFSELFYSLKVFKKANRRFLNIRIESFEAGLSESLSTRILQILSEKTIDGFVLDLRGNPGGNTQEASRVISMFVRDKVLSYFRIGARGIGEAKPIHSLPQFFVSDSIPLLVQVDQHTKSAAEIVASSLKSLKRSITVGSRTFGKLVGQSYREIELLNQKKLGLLVSSFEFFNAQGQSLNQVGVLPDVVLGSSSFNGRPDGLKPGKDLDMDQLEGYSPYELDLAKALESLPQEAPIEFANIDGLSVDLLLHISKNQTSDVAQK